MNPRRQAWTALALLTTLVALAPLRPAPRSSPSRLDASRAEAWMADCLPGIGPRRREMAATALRDGRWNDLPQAARIAAAEAFNPR